MAAWSQSPCLQALGWAMLNSLWQMAALFAGFTIFIHLVSLSTQKKYYLAIASMGAGFVWFVYTFFIFFNAGITGTVYLQHRLAPTSKSWNLILSSASLVYLLLLLIPAFRLFRNWRYIEDLKKFGHDKTALKYRLFVKKVAQKLNIKHTVRVYISHFVQSPVTIGYIKPIILLPVAAINNLNAQQVEAILLHELAHIKRYDYLFNFIITLLRTVFYFNPFVKKFVTVIEFEREKCCDELVLQFQYNRISYASALLLLEKSRKALEVLSLAAAGKKHLLRRIEKIVGLEKKAGFTFHQFAGLLAAFLLVLFINSLFFINKDVKLSTNHSLVAYENPLYDFDKAPASKTFSKAHAAKQTAFEKHLFKNAGSYSTKTFNSTVIPQVQPIIDKVIHASYDASDELLTPEDKQLIAQTLETTKKVLTRTKWKEVEKSIGDGMTAKEKKNAEHEYLKEVNKIDWKTLESRLKSGYENLNWAEIDSKLNTALSDLKLDSLQQSYLAILLQLQKSEVKKSTIYKDPLPIPDASIRDIISTKDEVKAKLDSIKVVRNRKIINF